jgi:hypothetical protein
MFVTQRSLKSGFRDTREVVVTFQIATAVAVMGLFTIVAVYFLWVRKLDKKEENQ